MILKAYIDIKERSFYPNYLYSAETGRFISPDPIGFSGGDLNLYRYVNHSNFTDSSGLFFISGAIIDVIAGIRTLGRNFCGPQ